jgi:transcriptional regulator with XRE-family HTH domain
MNNPVTTKNTVRLSVGQRIAEARRHVGFTQGQLAERLGWSRDALINYEHGRRALSVERLIAIAHALDMSPAALLIDDAVAASLVHRLLAEPELYAQVRFFLSTLDDS